MYYADVVYKPCAIPGPVFDGLGLGGLTEAACCVLLEDAFERLGWSLYVLKQACLLDNESKT
jgi:hypothetical protein